MTNVNRTGVGGPIPKFSDYHLWKALISLDEGRPIGRKRLATLLGIGEGSTRTIITMMQDQGMIAIDRGGITLTKKGVERRDTLYMDVAPLTADASLTIGRFNCAVRIPHAAKRITYGCEERDASIKAGAVGATTLVFLNGKLIFPGSEYPVDSKIENALHSLFRLKNEDAIIIGTADTYDAAEKGAVTAAFGLIGGIIMNRDLKDILSSRSNASELLSLAFAVHDLVGGLPVCAKSRNNLGIRIENGAVIDNAYTGDILEEVIRLGTTIRKVAESGPYRGIRVIVTPIEVDGRAIAAIGVVDARGIWQNRNDLQ
jgi:hypothetical protein